MLKASCTSLLGLVGLLTLLTACGNNSPTPLSPDDQSPSLAAACGTPPCGGVRLLARWESGSGGGGTHSTRVFNPAGVAICLVHESRLELDPNLPYPAAILGGDFSTSSLVVIGCDQALTSPQTIEFNAGNSPGFAEFAVRMTNGVDERVHRYAQLVDAQLMFDGSGGAAGSFESSITQSKGKNARSFNSENSNDPRRSQSQS